MGAMCGVVGLTGVATPAGAATYETESEYTAAEEPTGEVVFSIARRGKGDKRERPKREAPDVDVPVTSPPTQPPPPPPPP
ncbi:MAG: hypothetical protein ACRDY7_00900, partial [Acidimicrobiia bacterium]